MKKNDIFELEKERYGTDTAVEIPDIFISCEPCKCKCRAVKLFCLLRVYLIERLWRNLICDACPLWCEIRVRKQMDGVLNIWSAPYADCLFAEDDICVFLVDIVRNRSHSIDF